MNFSDFVEHWQYSYEMHNCDSDYNCVNWMFKQDIDTIYFDNNETLNNLKGSARKAILIELIIENDEEYTDILSKEYFKFKKSKYFKDFKENFESSDEEDEDNSNKKTSYCCLI